MEEVLVLQTTAKFTMQFQTRAQQTKPTGRPVLQMVAQNVSMATVVTAALLMQTVLISIRLLDCAP